MSHLLDDVKAKIAAAIVLVMPDAAGVDLTARMSIVDKHDSDLALPCFCLKGHVPGAPAEVAKRLAAALSQYWTEHHDGPVKQVVAAGPYVNMLLTTRCIASVIAPIQSGAYLSSRPSTGKRLMVEYSQPNTLKAFHVGHTRNVSIGDALVRLNEAVGHHVVAANFFGDEGAHVAKALWMVSEWLRARPTFDLDRDVPEAERGEWLGAMYASAVEALDLSSLTHYAVEDASIVLAKVLSIQVLPTALTWQVIRLQVNKDVTHIVTIVSDKLGFVVGDCVAFRPSKEPPMELHGIINAGSVLTLAELSSCSSKKTLEADTSRVASLLVSDMCVGMSPAQLNYRHCQVLSAEQATQAEADRKFHLFVIPTTEIVLEEHAHRHQAVKNVLRILEAADPKEPLVMLWRKTNAWSITEFERIYTWLGARFDVRFYESECSEPSRALVNDPKWRTGPDPVFVESEGALGADLSAYKLGFALVLKRDGTGLYATKDLALAQIKFDRYAIDQSIYVVDAAQTLHFKQVFKILERMGYRQASKCLHIAYGQVRGRGILANSLVSPFHPPQMRLREYSPWGL
jgi:arginyl-tRNA synthetase